MSLNAQPGIIPTWTVADRYRKARETRGLSQAELALQAGLSRRTIGAIETGEKVPGVKESNLWQLITGVPREWLETGEGPSGDGSTPPEGERPRRFLGRTLGLPGLDSNQEPIGFLRLVAA